MLWDDARNYLAVTSFKKKILSISENEMQIIAAELCQVLQHHVRHDTLKGNNLI